MVKYNIKIQRSTLPQINYNKLIAHSTVPNCTWKYYKTLDTSHVSTKISKRVPEK